MRGVLNNMLVRGHYVIASVVLDTSTGWVTSHDLSPENANPRTYVGHWVVLTGLQGGLVRINNPFANREEYVSWGVFHLSVIKSMGTMLEVYPWAGEEDEINLQSEAAEYGICQ